jgi:hypothetical protein
MYHAWTVSVVRRPARYVRPGILKKITMTQIQESYEKFVCVLLCVSSQVFRGLPKSPKELMRYQRPHGRVRLMQHHEQIVHLAQHAGGTRSHRFVQMTHLSGRRKETRHGIRKQRRDHLGNNWSISSSRRGHLIQSSMSGHDALIRVMKALQKVVLDPIIVHKTLQHRIDETGVAQIDKPLESRTKGPRAQIGHPKSLNHCRPLQPRKPWEVHGHGPPASTATHVGRHRVSSDPRSQADDGAVSTMMGDRMGILRAVVLLLSVCTGCFGGDPSHICPSLECKDDRVIGHAFFKIGLPMSSKGNALLGPTSRYMLKMGALNADPIHLSAEFPDSM